MVKSWLRFLGKEFGGLHEAALLLALATLLSQVLALVRDRLLAGTFGAGSSLDIYYTAFRLPDLIYATIASFISITVVIPFLVERLETGEQNLAKDFLSAVFTVFSCVLVVVSLVAYCLLPYLAPYIAPGFSSSALEQLISLSRILLLSPLLLGLSNLLGSITQTYRKFLIFSLSPVVYNIGIILGIMFLVPIWGLTGLAWGVVLGALGHLLIQLPIIYRVGLWPSFSLFAVRSNRGVLTKLIWISWPRTLTLSSSQLVMLVLLALASYLGKGSVAIFNFSFNLQSVPLAIIGVSYSVAAFPTLSRYFAKGQIDYFLKQIELASRHIAFWSLPTIFMFVVLRAQIVRVILGFGNFDWTATRLTAACLALFAISVSAQSLVALLVRAYYASGRTFKPLLISIASSGLIVALAFGLSFLFRELESWRLFWENILRVRGLPGSAILMLPLAYTIGLLFNLAVLTIAFVIDYRYRWRVIADSVGKSLVGAVWGGVTAYLILGYLGPYLDLNTVYGIFMQGFVAGLGGLLINFIILLILGSQELREILTAIRHKFWQKEAIVPEQSEL